MHKSLIALLVLGLVACSSRDLVIRDVTVISPERTAAKAGTDVHIRDGRIIRIGSDLTVPRGAVELPAHGRYLIPGLIDSHVHIYHATGLRRRYTDDYDALHSAYMEQAPRSYLYFGYTTLIELNADFKANERFSEGPVAPDLLHCGKGVVLPNGYMALEVPEKRLETVYPHYLHDPYGSDYLPAGADPARHTPEAVVEAVAEAGGICVKLYYEEARWMPGGAPAFALPSIEILQAVDKAANARGMTTLLHATTPAGHRIGLAAGIDVMAHGLFEWPGVPFSSQVMPDDVADTLAAQAAAGMHVQPTLQTLRNTASMFESGSLDDPNLRRVLPESYLAYLATDAQEQREAFMRLFGAAIDPDAGVAEMRTHQEGFNRRYEEAVRRLDADGGRLLFGTDTAVGGFGWGNPPGLNGYREMRGWARAGISLRTIFEAATLHNARAFGLESELGSIEVGKQADLLVLRENPLERISAYDSIDKVIVDGVVHDRTQFDASAQP